MLQIFQDGPLIRVMTTGEPRIRLPQDNIYLAQWSIPTSKEFIQAKEPLSDLSESNGRCTFLCGLVDSPGISD